MENAVFFQLTHSLEKEISWGTFTLPGTETDIKTDTDITELGTVLNACVGICLHEV